MKNRGNTSRAEFRAVLLVAGLLIIGFTLPDIVYRLNPDDAASPVIVVYAEKENGNQNGNSNGNRNGNGNRNYNGNHNVNRNRNSNYKVNSTSGSQGYVSFSNETSVEMSVQEIQCETFDPNTVSTETLVSMGVNGYAAGNLVKYRDSGGKFRTAGDVERIYGMDSITFTRLRHCIDIRKAPSRHNADSELVEINTATLEEWKSLKGIGEVYAARIIKFRESLGGFHSVDQVAETYGLPEETWEQIRPSLHLVSGHSRIEINTVNVQELSRHPYISHRMAKALVSYREHNGQFKTVEDLGRVYVMNDSVITKLTPYLALESGSPELTSIAANTD